MSQESLFAELFDLSGRVALVTGGSKGLGRASAEALAEAGAAVALCSRNAEEAEGAAAEIADATGRRCAGLAADVTEAGQVEGLLRDVARDLGAIDILVCSAGINIRRPTVELTEAEWDAVINTNLKGSFLVSRGVMPGMRERSWGRIVLLGSILSFISLPGRAAYAASKAGLLGLTRTLALEGVKENVCVNAICPGPFMTPMNLSLAEDKAKNQAILEKVPMGRWGDPKELRGLVLYLSSAACSFMTGSALLIDGGWTAQ
jgi:NAD(P)-dependent dehydrogenase (short-subunit alcohol dehydrogenase family)